MHILLTLIIAIPFVGGLLAWIISHVNEKAARWTALVASGSGLPVGLYMWSVDPVTETGQMVASIRVPWITHFGIDYHLAMDGLGLLMVILTSILGVIAVACSWTEIRERVGAFHFALCALLSGIMGVFLAFDMFLFYFFWELMLVPMYFLIGLWGHENRIYAAVKFFLFTFISGLFMLAAIIGLYVVHGQATGDYTFDYTRLLATPMAKETSMLLMLGMFVGFAVKLPMFPLHTWLPDAHTEAPTAGSVILAGLMLKTGAYGLMRFTVPLFPESSAIIAKGVIILGIAGIIYGAVLAFAQTDMKRLIAYTSVSHLGFVLLGIYVGNRLALEGTVMQIICHGLSTGALFLISGMVRERTHTRNMDKLGGLFAVTPKLGGFTVFFALTALGLPGFGTFVGEFLILLGTFEVSPVLAEVEIIGLIVSVLYALRLVQRTVFGPNTNAISIPDIGKREIAILGVLGVMLLGLGFYPRPVFQAAKHSLPAIEEALHPTRAMHVQGDRP